MPGVRRSRRQTSWRCLCVGRSREDRDQRGYLPRRRAKELKTPAGPVTTRYATTVLAFALITVVVAPIAYMAIFNGFEPYDDEGIFLVTLRDYLSGHPVLTPYVPLYGPFFYEVMGGLFKLMGLQPTHETGRWVTLVVWLIASVVGGLAALILTRKLSIAAFPLLLTAGALNRDSVLEFAIVVALSAAAVGVSAIAAGGASAPSLSTAWLAAGAVAIVVACIGVALAGGSRLEDGWTALFLFAFKFPGVFTHPIRVNPLLDLWAAVPLAAVVIIGRGTLAAVPSVAAGGVRIAAGFLMWISILLPGPIFLLALPLAWLATQQPTDDHQSPTDPYARLLLPALAVVESLQAYPVAGTQLALAAVGLIPVAAITLNDGLRQIRRLDAPRTKWVKLAAWMAPATLLTTIGMLELNGLLALVWFSGGVPLGLPGAESIRLPTEQAVQLRAVVSAVEGNNCSTLITSPGMDSF